jgi:hypothetical protein
MTKAILVVWAQFTIGTPKEHQKLLSKTTARYISSIHSTKVNISGIDTIDNWHTKGHTNSFIQYHGKIYNFYTQTQSQYYLYIYN